MSEYQILTIFAAFAFAYSLIATRLEKTPFNGALVYVAVGMLFGPQVLGLIDLPVDGEAVSWLAEIALAICLFTDSSNADLSVLRRVEAIPVRLLLIGLPLTIALGLGLAWLIFGDLGFFEIALIATMLAPTDAALGKAVVTNPVVPAKVRESLNVESGLNDGICVPVILFFIALAAGSVEASESAGLVVQLPLEVIGIGMAVGLVLAVVGRICSAELREPRLGIRHLVADADHCACPVMFCLGSVAGGQRLHCLVCRRSDLWSFHEAAQRAILGCRRRHRRRGCHGDLVYLRDRDPRSAAFRFQLAGIAVRAAQSDAWFGCCRSSLCLLGKGFRPDTLLFMGWFGPRGLASIVFVVMVIGEKLPGNDTIVAVVAWTIVLSIVLHGLSANPLAAKYGRRVEARGGTI